MGDQTTADSIITGQAGSVIAEGQKVAQATAGASSITPSTITAMVGISKNQALQIAPSVTSAMSSLQAVASNSLHPDHIAAQNALTNLTSLQGKLGFTGSPATDNHAAFGSFLNQAQGHIGTSAEIKTATNFMEKTSFADLGSGVTNMSSMTTQGLDGALGSLPSAANALSAAGPCFDMSNMATFGTGAGLVSKLSSAKLANQTGLNSALATNGVSLNPTDIIDPVYADSIDSTLASIKDPTQIAAVKETLGINPPGAINSLKDLTDINKLAPAGSVTGLSGGLTGIGTKFKDLGASFKTPDAASGLLNNIQVPSIPSLDAAAPDLGAYISGLAPDITNMTGGSYASALTGTMPGIPSMHDFTHVVSGGDHFDALSSVGGVNSTTIAALEAQTAMSNDLFTNVAKIDLNSPMPNGASSAMNFATSLHKIGADTSGSGITDVLYSLAVPGSAAGDSIKASLAEGKNKALMAAQGIKPLNFTG